MSRWLTTLLLCLAIPLQGWASGRSGCDPCPGHAAPSAEAALGQVDAQAAAEGAGAGSPQNCCDAGALAPGAHAACQGAPGCHGSTAALLPQLLPLVLAGAPTGVDARPGSPVPGGDPGACWRPPRATFV